MRGVFGRCRVFVVVFLFTLVVGHAAEAGTPSPVRRSNPVTNFVVRILDKLRIPPADPDPVPQAAAKVAKSAVPK